MSAVLVASFHIGAVRKRTRARSGVVYGGDRGAVHTNRVFALSPKGRDARLARRFLASVVDQTRGGQNH